MTVVSLKASLINIWSLVNGQVESDTSRLWFADYFTVVACEFARSHRSVLFKPCRPAGFFILWFPKKVLDKRHHAWTSCALQPNQGDMDGVFSICCLNNITRQKRNTFRYMWGSRSQNDGYLSVIPLLTEKTTCALLISSLTEDYMLPFAWCYVKQRHFQLNYNRHQQW